MTEENKDQSLNNNPSSSSSPEAGNDPNGTSERSINHSKKSQKQTCPKIKRYRTNRVIMCATVVIAVATCVYAVIAGLQWDTMSGQLNQMIESSCQTNQLIEAANKQGNAMIETAIANKITAEASRLRDRAFVYFVNPIERPYSDIWGIDITMMNSGNIPARLISVRCDCQYTKKVLDQTPSTKWPIIDAPNFVGPKDRVSLQGCGIPNRAIIAAQNQEIYIFVLMEVKYTDGINNRKMRVTQVGRSLRFDKRREHSWGFAGPDCTDHYCSKK